MSSSSSSASKAVPLSSWVILAGGTSFHTVYTLQRQDAKFVSNQAIYNLQIT